MPEERTANHYTLLELLPNATDADIKKAWHEQIQVWHPDRFNHAPTLHRKAEARTQLINQAYQTLSDPIARTSYDTKIQPSASHGTPPRPSPATGPSSESYSSTASRPQQRPRSPQDPRGPQSLIMLSRQGQPTTMVPAIHLYVDPREHFPYDFHGFVPIAGVIREPLSAGSYAEYAAVLDGDALALRVGEPASDLEAYWPAQRYAIITAWNPASVPLSDTANKTANAALVARLDAAGLSRHPAHAFDSSGDWREAGWLVADVDTKLLDQLGREFGQAGVLSWVRGEPVRLRMLLPRPPHAPSDPRVEWAPDSHPDRRKPPVIA